MFTCIAHVLAFGTHASQVPTNQDSQGRCRPWLFDKGNANVLNLPLVDMGESLTYNPRAKVSKKKDSETPAQALPKKRAGKRCKTLQEHTLPTEQLTKERAKLWLDDVVLAVDSVLDSDTNTTPHPKLGVIRSFMYGLALEFCFAKELKIGDKVYLTWSSLRQRIRSLATWALQLGGVDKLLSTGESDEQYEDVAAALLSTTVGAASEPHGMSHDLEVNIEMGLTSPAAQTLAGFLNDNPIRDDIRFHISYQNLLRAAKRGFDEAAKENEKLTLAIALEKTQQGLAQVIIPEWIQIAKGVVLVIRETMELPAKAQAIFGHSVTVPEEFLCLRGKYCAQLFVDVFSPGKRGLIDFKTMVSVEEQPTFSAIVDSMLQPAATAAAKELELRLATQHSSLSEVGWRTAWETFLRTCAAKSEATVYTSAVRAALQAVRNHAEPPASLEGATSSRDALANLEQPTADAQDINQDQRPCPAEPSGGYTLTDILTFVDETNDSSKSEDADSVSP